MKTKSNKNPDSAVHKRRKMMRDALHQHGFFNMADILKKCGQSPGRESLKGDFEALTLEGLRMSKEGRAGSTKWILIDDHQNPKARAMNNPLGKRDVGLVACGLVVGFPPGLENVDGSLAQGVRKSLKSGIFASVPDQNHILLKLTGPASNQGNASRKAQEVHMKLVRYWSEMYRIVAIDSSTTNDQTVQLLSELPIPVPPKLGNLCALSVAINSREAFYSLGRPEVDARALMIGGEQVGRRPAVAGRLAEVFLRSAALYTFGMALVGAARVNLSRGLVEASDVETASLKVLLFQKSLLRIICVDHTKLDHAAPAASYEMVALSPEHLDLIVVNRPTSAAEVEQFEHNIAQIRELGIAVLDYRAPD